MCNSKSSAPLEAVRCASCAALLFKVEAGAMRGRIEIKCRRCSALNVLRPTSPQPIAAGATEKGNGLCGSSFRTTS